MIAVAKCKLAFAVRQTRVWAYIVIAITMSKKLNFHLATSMMSSKMETEFRESVWYISLPLIRNDLGLGSLDGGPAAARVANSCALSPLWL